MDRRLFLTGQLLAFSGAMAVAGALTGTASAAPQGVVIAIPLIKTANASDKDLLNAIRRFADYIRNAPGFLEGTLLKASFESTSFDYLDVTRWESQRHWEDLFSREEFLELIEKNNAFTVKAADVFTPVALW